MGDGSQSFFTGIFSSSGGLCNVYAYEMSLCLSVSQSRLNETAETPNPNEAHYFFFYS